MIVEYAISSKSDHRQFFSVKLIQNLPFSNNGIKKKPREKESLMEP